MAELMRFKLDGGGTVLVEVSEDEPGVVRASRTGDVIEAAASTLGGALEDIRDAAATALDRFRAMSSRPDEIEIVFGVRLNAQAGAVIAKTGAEGHLHVRLTWHAPTPEGTV